jgi:hypothetical protein
MGEERCLQGFGWGKPEGKRHLENTGLKCEDNIKMDILEVSCNGNGLD